MTVPANRRAAVGYWDVDEHDHLPGERGASLRERAVLHLMDGRYTPAITFVQADGVSRQVVAWVGMSLMEAALRASIPGIDAKCRGHCACVTCHVYVDPAWHAVLGSPTAIEEDMLDFAFGVDERSRLSCQVRINDLCDGLKVEVPREQRILGV